MISETSLSPGLAERLRIRVRPDLVVRRQLYENQTHYVVKDPIGLHYFRFREEEYFLVTHLDGNRRLEEIKEDYERSFRPQKITIEELARFASQLTQAGLATVDTGGQGQLLYDRFRKTRFKQRLAAWSNVLYIKIPVFDPDKLLAWMLPFLRWIYHPAVVFATLAFWAAALLWVLSHFPAFQAKLPEFYTFFNWRNMIFMWASLGTVKIVHEFGHGLTCKYFGGECHEMGALLLVLSPCLYCDVSDSWLLPNKWQRVWIGAAGIYVELTMASIATFIWWNSEPGLLNNLALSTMFVCSVNTVMFNANPLLRYDGYYMLMDMMEIPNLRAKAARFFSSIFGKVCLGLPTDIETYLPRSRRVFFLLFAIASYVYRWFISFTILWFMYRFLRPYKLGTVSLLLAIGSLGTLLVVPSYQLGKFLWESRRMSTVSRLRLGLTLLVLAIAAGLVFFLPLPLTVSTSFVMMPQQPQFVWVEVPGQLREQLVKDGDTVETGDVLARLENYAKRDELVSLQRQVEQHRLEIDLHRFTGKDPSGSERKLAAELAEKMQELVETVQKDLNRLELRAERPGIVIQPPRPEQLGTSMPTGALFCLIGDAAKLEARLVIDQADIDLVDPGQTADLKLYSLPLQTIEGKLTEIGPAVETVPAELSNTAGGEVPTKTDPRTGQERPTHTHFEALVPVANPDNIMQPGMRGKAKIEARKLPLAGRIWRWVTRTFHFESG